MKGHQLLLVFVAGCKPELGAPASLVTAPAILAIRGEPAEAMAGADVTYTLLVASPDGTIAMPEAAWAFCTAPKPLTENNVVAQACLGQDAIAPIANAASMVTAATPADTCSRFGPDVPPAMPGQPMLRPRDADITGGYYQPMRVGMGDVTAFGLERITCNLANAPVDVSIEFRMRYHKNTNPVLLPLAARVAGQPAELAAIPSGAKVELEAAWSPDSVETFPVFDIPTQSLVDHHESMRVSWFATGGRFANDRTGRDQNDPATSTTNTWTAPDTAGMVHLWIVLRDSRGGVDFAGYDLTIR